MSRRIRTFRTPDRLVIGTVGLPGERTFYLQVTQDRQTVSIRMEKQQAATLAERFMDVLVTLEKQGAINAMMLPSGDPDDGPLDTPIDEDYTLGAIGLAWDGDADAFVLEFHEISESEPADVGDDDDDAPDTVRVWLASDRVREFIRRARAVVSAGRPDCPLCQLPLEPEGHICPRANGYRRSG